MNEIIIEIGEVEKQFLELIDKVENASAVIITRDGKPVAQIVPVSNEQNELPDTERDPEKIKRAIEGLAELRKGQSLDGLSIREMIDEGRR